MPLSGWSGLVVRRRNPLNSVELTVLHFAMLFAFLDIPYWIL